MIEFGDFSRCHARRGCCSLAVQCMRMTGDYCKAQVSSVRFEDACQAQQHARAASLLNQEIILACSAASVNSTGVPQERLLQSCCGVCGMPSDHCSAAGFGYRVEDACRVKQDSCDA